jgi:hypothetical protein
MDSVQNCDSYINIPSSQTHLGPMARCLLLSDSCEFVDEGRPLWREVGSVPCQSLSKIQYNLHCTCHMFYVYAIYTRPLSAQAWDSRSCHNSSLDTWTVLHLTAAKVKVKVYDRLVSGTNLGSATNFFHSRFFFLQFQVYLCGASSLTRSPVSTFQFLPGIASATFLKFESHENNEHSLLSRIRSHITTDSQSASQTWCQAPIWDPRPTLLSPWNCLQTVAGL